MCTVFYTVDKLLLFWAIFIDCIAERKKINKQCCPFASLFAFSCVHKHTYACPFFLTMWQRGQKNNCRPLNSENESCGTKVLAYTVRMRHTDRISHVQGVDVTDPIGVSHATCFSLSILLIHLSYEKYFSGPSAMWTRECGANLLWSDDTVNFYFWGNSGHVVVVDPCRPQQPLMGLASLALFSPRYGRVPLEGCVYAFLAIYSLFSQLTLVNRQRQLAQPRVDPQAIFSLFARLTLVNRQRQLAHPRADLYIGVCTVTCTQSVRGYSFHPLVACGPGHAHRRNLTFVQRPGHPLVVRVSD